jgi:hypothetical protein
VVDRLIAAVLLACALPGLLPAQLMTRQKPETDLAFDNYIKGVESRLDWQPRVTLAANQVTIVPGATEPMVVLDGAIVHDWRAAVLAPRVKIEKLIALLQSYDDYPRHYAPQVTAAKVYNHEGNLWRVFLKLHKKSILTANLNTDYEIEYRPLGPSRWGILSRSTKVTELDDGRELPVGQGHGFLWRLNAYWVLEQRADGVYMECRAISMSRDVPVALRWLVMPMLTSVPRESLQYTLEATVRALQ